MQNAIKYLSSEKIKICNFIIIRSSGQIPFFFFFRQNCQQLDQNKADVKELHARCCAGQNMTLCSTQAHSFQVVMCLRNLPSLSSLRGCEVAPWLLWASL